VHAVRAIAAAAGVWNLPCDASQLQQAMNAAELHHTQSPRRNRSPAEVLLPRGDVVLGAF